MADTSSSQPQGSESAAQHPMPTIANPVISAPTPNLVPQLSSPAPILRPAIPGGRSGGRAPRLGLAIPPSLNVKAVGGQAAQPAPSRPPLPTLNLATLASE